MITPRAIVEFVTNEPFRPFRLHMASGRTFDVKHPEMIKVGKSSVIIYSPPDEAPMKPDRWKDVSLMLMESVELIDLSANNAGRN